MDPRGRALCIHDQASNHGSTEQTGVGRISYRNFSNPGRLSPASGSVEIIFRSTTCLRRGSYDVYYQALVRYSSS